MTRPVALALRALGLGDFLTGLPALSLLKQALSDHSVVLAAPAVFAPLVPYVRAIDGLLPAGELMPLNRDYAGVDVAVDLHGKGPESRRLLADLQPGRLVAFADPAAGFPGPPWYPGEHEVARWCRLVATGVSPGGRSVADRRRWGGCPAGRHPGGLEGCPPGIGHSSRADVGTSRGRRGVSSLARRTVRDGGHPAEATKAIGS